MRGDDQPFPCIECGEQVANFVSSVLLIDATLSGSVRKVSSPLDPEPRRTLGGVHEGADDLEGRLQPRQRDDRVGLLVEDCERRLVRRTRRVPLGAEPLAVDDSEPRDIGFAIGMSGVTGTSTPPSGDPLVARSRQSGRSEARVPTSRASLSRI